MKQSYVLFVCADDKDGTILNELVREVEKRDIYTIKVPKNALSFYFFDMENGEKKNVSCTYIIGRFFERERLEKLVKVYKDMDCLIERIHKAKSLGAIKLRFSNLWTVYAGQTWVDLP